MPGEFNRLENRPNCLEFEKYVFVFWFTDFLPRFNNQITIWLCSFSIGGVWRHKAALLDATSIKQSN
jgi:hypothetical protein